MTEVLTGAEPLYGSLEELLENIDFHTPNSMFGIPYGHIERMTGMDTADIKADTLRLTKTGEWDHIPGFGTRPSLWFHTADLLTAELTITDATKKAAEQTLTAYERNCTTGWWEDLPEDAKRPELLDMTVRIHAGILKATLRIEPSDVSVNTVLTVCMTLAAHYLVNGGFTCLTHKDLANLSNCSTKSVRSALAVITKAGVWGSINGTGFNQGRYYPMFIERSRSQFLRLTERA